MFDKTINLLLFGGDPNGMLRCELSNWNGRVYKIPRPKLSEFSGRNDAESTGVYFLFGQNDRGDKAVYVGEAESISGRVKQHLDDAHYWTECVVVISKDDLLNKAHVKYMESCFYRMAKEAGRYHLINSNVPTQSSVSEYDEAMLKEFMAHTKLLMSTLGYKLFESVEDLQINREDSIFSIKAVRGVNAQGMLSTEGFVVQKGSQAACDVVPSMPINAVQVRRALYEKGIINANHIFEKDQLFSSPSLAATVVMGRSANGRIEWKNKNHQSIKDMELLE